jgi:hypothetical protein
MLPIFVLMVSGLLILGGGIGLLVFGVRDGIVRARRLARTPPIDQIEADKRREDRKKTRDRVIGSVIALVAGLILLVLLLRGIQGWWGPPAETGERERVPGELHTSS